MQLATTVPLIIGSTLSIAVIGWLLFSTPTPGGMPDLKTPPLNRVSPGVLATLRRQHRQQLKERLLRRALRDIRDCGETGQRTIVLGYLPQKVGICDGVTTGDLSNPDVVRHVDSILVEVADYLRDQGFVVEDDGCEGDAVATGAVPRLRAARSMQRRITVHVPDSAET